jgi:O-antigen/teichoic acid export membrane protein
MPVMSSLYAAGRARELRTVIWSATGTATGVALAASSVLLLGRDLIMSLYGPEFSEAGDVLAIIALSVLVVTVFQPSLQLLAATGRMGTSAVTNLVWAATFIVAAIRLVPDGGALGLATAYLVAFGVQAVLVLGLGSRVLSGMRPRAETPSANVTGRP